MAFWNWNWIYGERVVEREIELNLKGNRSAFISHLIDLNNIPILPSPESLDSLKIGGGVLSWICKVSLAIIGRISLCVISI